MASGRFTFDPEDRLTGIGSPSFSALYDGDGLRAVKAESLSPTANDPQTTYFLNDGGGRPVLEETFANNAATLSVVNLFGADGWRARDYPGPVTVSDQFYAFSFDPEGDVVSRQNGGDGLDAAYDLAAYDLAAYDLAAYDLAAYDLAAYDLAAYDLAAYDLAAYDLAAYDLAAYDLAAYDLAAYDLAAYDLAAYDLAAYEGYGRRTADVFAVTGSGPAPHQDPARFGGQWGYYTDGETGLLCLTHRYYDPGTGRFVTRDPAGYGGGVNLYGFANDNPVNEMDPSGLDPWWRRFGRWLRRETLGTTDIRPLGVDRGDEGLDGDDAGGDSSSILSPLARHPQQSRQYVRSGINQVAGIVVGSVASAPLGGDEEELEAGGVAANRALHELYLRELRESMAAPHAEDPELATEIGELWRANATVGSGSTAAAIRYERTIGLPVGGAWHSQKGENAIRFLEKWISNNPGARPGDMATAENIVKDLKDALGR